MEDKNSKLLNELEETQVRTKKQLETQSIELNCVRNNEVKVREMLREQLIELKNYKVRESLHTEQLEAKTKENMTLRTRLKSAVRDLEAMKEIHMNCQRPLGKRKRPLNDGDYEVGGREYKRLEIDFGQPQSKPKFAAMSSDIQVDKYRSTSGSQATATPGQNIITDHSHVLRENCISEARRKMCNTGARQSAHDRKAEDETPSDKNRERELEILSPAHIPEEIRSKAQIRKTFCSLMERRRSDSSTYRKPCLQRVISQRPRRRSLPSYSVIVEPDDRHVEVQSKSPYESE